MNRPSKSPAEALISVARDFSPHPGPRTKDLGAHSGELFRERLLALLAVHDRILVDLDGTSGFGSSFLDEAFGGLVSKAGLSRAEVLRRISVKSDEDQTYRLEALDAIRLAKRNRQPD